MLSTLGLYMKDPMCKLSCRWTRVLTRQYYGMFCGLSGSKRCGQARTRVTGLSTTQKYLTFCRARHFCALWLQGIVQVQAPHARLTVHAVHGRWQENFAVVVSNVVLHDGKFDTDGLVWYCALCHAGTIFPSTKIMSP